MIRINLSVTREIRVQRVFDEHLFQLQLRQLVRAKCWVRSDNTIRRRPLNPHQLLHIYLVYRMLWLFGAAKQQSMSSIEKHTFLR